MKLKTTILILFLFYFLESTPFMGVVVEIGIDTSVNFFILEYLYADFKTLTRMGFNTPLNDCLLLNINYEEKNNLFKNNLEKQEQEYSLNLNLNYKF